MALHKVIVCAETGHASEIEGVESHSWMYISLHDRLPVILWPCQDRGRGRPRVRSFFPEESG
jgi:hypothetical protein